MPDSRDRPAPPEALLAEVRWVQALARRLARDADTAEDLAQGTLAVAIQDPPLGDRPLRPWLARVLRNLARRRERSEARRRAREHAVSRNEVIGAEGALLEQFEEQRRIAKLVAALEPELRSLILSRYWRGESTAQIARATGVKPGTVRARLARALAKLNQAHRRELGDERSRTALAIAVVPELTASTPLLVAPLVVMKSSVKLAAAVAALLVGFLGWRALDQESRSARGTTAVVVEDAPVPASGSGAPGPASTAAPTSERATVAAPAAPPPPVAAARHGSTRPRVELRVIDEALHPIAGARLVFIHRNGEPRDLPPSARSGPDGCIAVEIPRAATFRYNGDEGTELAPLRLEAPGFASCLFVEGVESEGVENLGERVLRLGSSVAGRVVDERGRGVPEVAVVARSFHGRSERSAGAAGSTRQFDAPSDEEPSLRGATAPDGSFALDGLEVGPQELWFRRAGDRWRRSPAFESLAGARREGFVLELLPVAPERLVRGRVARPDGSEAAEAFLRYRHGPYWEDERVPVDDAGRFQLELDLGATADVVAFARDESFGPSPTVVGAAGGPEILLVLSQARWLPVVVHDDGGRPLEGAQLIPRVPFPAGRAWRPGDDSMDLQGRDPTRTDAGGAAQMLVPGQSFHVLVGHLSCAELELGPLDPAALPERLAVELERRPELQGVVTAGGKPVAGAHVFLMSEWSNARLLYRGFGARLHDDGGFECTTDGEGRFRRPVADLGRYPSVLLVEAAGFARAEVPLGLIRSVDDVGTIEVRLGGGGRLEGRVLVAPGRAPQGVVVGCSRDDSRPLFTRTNANGRYAFAHLTPGPLRVEVFAGEPEGRLLKRVQPGQHPFDPNVEIREGGVTPFDFDLRWQADLRVNGRLTLDGAPPSEWSAFVEPADGTAPSSTLEAMALDDFGRFSVPAVPGAVVLVLQSESGSVRSTLRRELSVDAATPALELALRTATIQGKDLAPAELLRLNSHQEDGTRVVQEFAADASGAFRVQVVAGSAVVTRAPNEPLSATDVQARQRRVDLVPGATHSLWE